VERHVEASANLRAPLDRVRSVLDGDPAAVMASPELTATTDRAFVSTVTVRLRSGMAACQEVTLQIGRVTEAGDGELRWPLHWTPTGRSRLLPELTGILSAVHQPGGTVLHLASVYDPPFGAAGAFGDGLVGHRLARAAVTQFMDRLADRLDREVDRRTQEVLAASEPTGAPTMLPPLTDTWIR
jgi:hypothetical protein